MKWIGTQTIYDQVRFKKDISLYSAINDGDPTISLGSSATERLEIKATYESGAQGLDAVEFITYTASSSAHDGRFIFKVDGVNTFQIKDSLVNIMESGKLTIGNVDILSDSSGTTTLKNIDALDATTEATIEAAIDTLSTLAGPMEIEQGASGGGAALLIDNNDLDQIALDIEAANTTADVINITADAVTTANVIDISCDALTTGSALKIEDDSSVAGLSGARNVVDIYQKNTAAVNATALQVKSDGGQVGVLIDKNASRDLGQNMSALHVDLDRTVAGSGTAAHNDIGINVDVNSASLGTSTLKGMEIDVVGATSGTSTATGIDLTVSGADGNIGMLCETAGGTGFKHTNTNTSSATEGGKIILVSDDGAALGDDHRLGIIQFNAAEDGSGTNRVGASIQAFADAAWSDTVNDTRLEFYTMDGNNTSELSLTLDSDKQATFTGSILANNATTSSATEGGKLVLISDDGAALGDDHRLGVVAFKAAEDGSSTLKTGAKIQAMADAAWSASENGTRLEFYTMDGNASQELSLTLDSDLLATFAGGITAAGTITGDAGFAGDVTGDVSGQAGTVATIAGLAPNTATTQATQAAITSCANLATVGTIGTGVWQGTAVATDQQKHLAWFTLRGYGTGDGTNYEIPELMTDDNAPFEHNTSAGSDGLTAQTVQTMMRLGGVVAPRAGTLKKWYGWATTAGSSTANIGLFRVRPTRNDNTNLTPVLLDNVSYTALGNTKMEDFDETSFTDADIAVGDIIYTGIKCQSAKATYLSSTLEIEWD